VAMSEWLEPELQRGLRQVAAPPELWDRVRSARSVRPQEISRRLVWAMAATVALAAVALSLISAPMRKDSGRGAFYCQNPAQLRAWVRANAGLDVPLRPSQPTSIQLTGARIVPRGVEVMYRAGQSDAVLLVTKAGAGSPDSPHSRVSGQLSSWAMSGQRFTLACNNSADFQLACKLCHLD
jgi:hypothetical protein